MHIRSDTHTHSQVHTPYCNLKQYFRYSRVGMVKMRIALTGSLLWSVCSLQPTGDKICGLPLFLVMLTLTALIIYILYTFLEQPCTISGLWVHHDKLVCLPFPFFDHLMRS